VARGLLARAGVLVGLTAASSVDGLSGSTTGASDVAAAARAAADFEAAVVRGAAFVVRGAVDFLAAGLFAAGFLAAGDFAAGVAVEAAPPARGVGAGSVSVDGVAAAARFAAAVAALDVRARAGVVGVARPDAPALARGF